MLLKKYNIIFIIILSAFHASGQLTITFPMEKAVFQRNLNNQANLPIAGNFNTPITSIEARLLDAFNANNVIVDWTAIQYNPSGGVFNGYLANVNGGWYILEVKAMLNGNQIGGYASRSPIGVGEVFIIAGQSNASGIEGNQGEVGANDPRVLSHNYNGVLCNNTVPDYPNFSQIFSNGSTRSYLSKSGPNPWCYGKLGDNLVSRLGVPVVFFNAAATASSTLNWKQSSDGLATISHYSNLQYCNSIGMPYNNFEKVLSYYVANFGARAILWHQGETDNYAQFIYNDCFDNLNYLINKSRTEINATIPWVIAKTSVFDKNANMGAGNPSANVISSQQNTVNYGNKIFAGPLTDDILGNDRSDEVHFHNGGLIELANRWDASLDGNFFSNATPISAKQLPDVTVICHSYTEQNLIAPGGFTSYRWVRTDIGNEDFTDAIESTSQNIIRSSGTYRCYLTDSDGNITFTQPITVQNVSSLCACSGFSSCNSVTYLSNQPPCTANNGYGPIEMDKSNGQNNGGDGGTLTLNGVTYQKGIGVHANSEISYLLNNNFGRFIAEVGIDDEIVADGSVRFEIYKDGIWSYSSPTMSASSNTVKINFDVTGVTELRLVVTDTGDGFFGDHADWANARLHCIDNQAPSAPTSPIATNIGQTCLRFSWGASTDNMEVEKYLIYQNNVLVSEVFANTLFYDFSGLNPATFYNLTVKAKDFTGNVSNTSNTLSVTTLSNVITSASIFTINIGQSVSISASNCNSGIIQWSTGQNGTSISVSPNTNTSYFATCFTNGCTSAFSNFTTITVIPNCTSNYTFTSPLSNFAGALINLTYNASNTITASNLISNQSKVNFNAARSITLNPGFKADNSTVFKAEIRNCPN